MKKQEKEKKEEKKQKKKSNTNNNKNKSKNKTCIKRVQKEGEENSSNYNFFNFDKKSNKDKNENNKVIDADILIKELKKEEEDTKILLDQLKSRKKVSRDFMKEMEQEKNIRDRYRTKKNLMEKKKEDEYNRMVNVIKDPINIKRTNKMEDKLYNYIEEYDNLNNNKLCLDDYYNNNDIIYERNEGRDKAEEKYAKLQFENKMKIKERQKKEEERKKQQLKMQKDNERFQQLIKNNFKVIKDNKKNGKNTNILFKEENNIEGTNLSPDMIVKEKRAKSSIKLKIKSGICQLPKVNENL